MRIKNTPSDAAARLDEVFEELRRAIFAAYIGLVDNNQDREVTIRGPSGSRR
jgi:hypothetical protein